MRLLLLVLTFALLLPLRVLAQDAPATLLADRIDFGRDQPLIAAGHVQVFYKGQTLTASRIIYDQSRGSLTIEGLITLDDGNGARVLASSAELDRDLQNGILMSARLVLQDRLQLAANSIERLGARYTRLNKTVTSACRICASNPVPLWQIRAREVIHDTEKHQIWFSDAQLRIMDFPVFWMPRLRIPDPTVDRATGFLVPRLRTTTQLGTGLKWPLFVTLGDHADVTLVPYLGAETSTLEVNYRQALGFGSVAINSAVSRDSIRPGDARGYLFGDALFSLPQDFQLDLQLRLVSDPGYLLDYSYSDEDRLVNSAKLFRTRRVSNFSASLSDIRTLRDSEIPIADTLPSKIAEVDWQRRYFPGFGEIDLHLAALVLSRESTLDMVGRDVARITAETTFHQGLVFGPGIAAEFEAGLGMAGYTINGDSTFDQQTGQVNLNTALTLRWPFLRGGRSGSTDLIEPVAQLAWSDRRGTAVPNEDSPVAEFDQGNLLALSHFPGDDQVETGLRLATGVNWSRNTKDGWSFGATAGRIIHFDDSAGFTAASGLDGKVSDLLTAFYAIHPGGITFNARALVAQDFDVTKATARVGYAADRFDLGASFDWMTADLAENRPDPLGEITMDTRWDITSNWTGRADLRLNAVEEKATRASFGLTYANECVTVDLSLSRRFTSSTSVEPTTDIGFRVVLGGLGEKISTARRVCAM